MWKLETVREKVLTSWRNYGINFDIAFQKYNTHIFESRMKKIAYSFNNKYKTTLAQTFKFPKEPVILVEINPDILKLDHEKILEILEHEMAHIVECRKHNSMGHGNNWQKIYNKYLKQSGNIQIEV